MCSVVVWQVRPRGVEEEVYLEEKVYLPRSSIPADLGGPIFSRVCMHSLPLFFWEMLQV